MLLPQPNSLFRHTADVILRPYVGSIVLTEFPKSGGTWLGQMLSEISGLPFVRDGFPPAKRYLIHKHCLPGLSSGNRPVVVFRDGRDVMVSLYHHAYFHKDIRTQRLTDRFSEKAPRGSEVLREDLPRFIEKCFTDPVYPRFSWAEFIKAWGNRDDVISASYEDLHKDPAETLSHLLHRLALEPQPGANLSETIKRNSFSVQSGGRPPGVGKADAFLRKGIVGDWADCFSRESAQVFHHYGGKALLALGYESNSEWVDKCAI